MLGTPLYLSPELCQHKPYALTTKNRRLRWFSDKGQFTRIGHIPGGVGHFCGRVARLATRQGLLHLSTLHYSLKGTACTTGGYNVGYAAVPLTRAVPAQALQPQDRRLVPRGKPPLSSCRFDSDVITLLFSTCHLWIVVKIL